MKNRLYPTLMKCTTSSESLFHHLPRIFRYFFTFYEIDTVGALSCLSVDQVKTYFPIPDAVCILIKVLVKFENRTKECNAAGARKLFCSPIHDQHRVASPRFTKVVLPFQDEHGGDKEPQIEPNEKWCVETKLLRHLEKAEYYLQQFRERDNGHFGTQKIVKLQLKKLKKEMEKH